MEVDESNKGNVDTGTRKWRRMILDALQYEQAFSWCEWFKGAALYPLGNFRQYELVYEYYYSSGLGKSPQQLVLASPSEATAAWAACAGVVKQRCCVDFPTSLYQPHHRTLRPLILLHLLKIIDLKFYFLYNQFYSRSLPETSS